MTDVTALLRRIERAVDRCCPAHLRSSRDDIVQTAMLKATTAMNDGRAVNQSWLRRVAYTSMIDEIRQRGVVVEEVQHLESPTVDPERNTRLARVRDALDHCMAHLTEARRRAVTLFLMGHTAKEAASLLTIEKRTAENLIFRGRSDLRLCLAKQGATVDSL